MARTMGPAFNTIGTNPYPPAKDKEPDFFVCELCDRKIGSKDWSAHKNSKKHRAYEDEVRRAKDKENYALVDNTGSPGTSVNKIDNPFHQPTWGEEGFVPKYARGTDNRTCNGCGEEGHIKRDCPKSASDRACYGCGKEGHQKRDCPEGGSGGGDRACYGCGKEGHQKRDCPEGGSGGGDRACFNCGMTGHRKVDCTSAPQPRQGGGDGQQCFNCYGYGHRKSECTNERVVKCRNCEELGHMSKECPKPTDWSKVQCNNCKEFGHSYKRCQAPPAEDTGSGGWGDSGADANSGAAATGNWEDNPAPAGGNSWGDAIVGDGW